MKVFYAIFESFEKSTNSLRSDYQQSAFFAKVRAFALIFFITFLATTKNARMFK